MDAYFTPSEVKRFPEALLGRVEKAIAPNEPGRVKLGATYYPAEFYQPDCQVTVFPEQRVNVVAIQGITLLVIPLTK